MYRYNFHITLVFLCILCFFIHSSEANPIYVFHSCGNRTFYTPNSTYEANLNTLLSSLSSNATNESGFQSTNIGQDAPNIAYGLYLCRGDLTLPDCQECVANLSTTIVQRCPRDKTAFLWYEECFLRFSNESFSSTFEEGPARTFPNVQNITGNQAQFMSLLTDQLTDLATQAAVTDRSGRKFASSEKNLTLFETLYSLAQCMPYLTESECNRCVRDAIGRLPLCCNAARGVKVVNPSCNVRDEVFPFYRITARAPRPPPPPPPASITPTPLPLPPSPRGKGKVSTQTIIAIVAPIGVSLVVLFLGCYFLLRKERQKYNPVTQGSGKYKRLITIM